MTWFKLIITARSNASVLRDCVKVLFAAKNYLSADRLVYACNVESLEACKKIQ